MLAHMPQPDFTHARSSLDTAVAGFRARLNLVEDTDWDRSTPCSEWTVRDLVTHLIGGGLMSEMLLDGASSSDARTTLFGLKVEGDLGAAFEEACERQRTAFARPDAGTTICHHPLRDMPAEQFIWLRIRDTAVHTWDLARAIGATEQLDARLVGDIWAQVEPNIDALGATGLFGAGASGTLPDDASQQDRLLDALGRRP